MNIYTCKLSFPYATKYISITLIAKSYEDARLSFIIKCIEKYDDIKKIDLEALCPALCERGYKYPLQINTPKDLEEYLEENVNRDTIECLNKCSFEIEDAYD